MKALEKLFDRIVQRVNINLRELEFDVNPFLKDLIPFGQLVKFYAFYGITPHHPWISIQKLQFGRQLFFRQMSGNQLNSIQKRCSR
jgi:hypothetical protein